ncbi:MOSC domain-containing protein [Candidatus Methylospira mobilis]|uniref:MOSC domain-containing protein n=1 Tax=Candidatus Methylospira mobilis TaxID=1808979 RepID=A0A5Q0BP10_9GAMM|nr:MOSC domain-containing protein [Candidatus Methylospira mobilis]QFY44001.1 MOSC domain-containing protein [Candidatus Methylospira mobilis]
MKLLSINLGHLQTIRYGKRDVETGIFKNPVDGVHSIGLLGLEGDRQADPENHGGVDKALYFYTMENFRVWEQELGRTLPSGAFGENFTVSGMPDEAVHIGDIFRVGGITVQVTQPRVPCFKLGIKMQDMQFVTRFLHSGRAGFYARILEPGVAAAGDSIALRVIDPHGLSVKEAMLALIKGDRQQEIIKRALKIPALSLAWQTDLRKRLQS